MISRIISCKDSIIKWEYDINILIYIWDYYIFWYILAHTTVYILWYLWETSIQILWYKTTTLQPCRWYTSNIDPHKKGLSNAKYPHKLTRILFIRPSPTYSTRLVMIQLKVGIQGAQAVWISSSNCYPHSFS